jgi:hypothetical protein
MHPPYTHEAMTTARAILYGGLTVSRVVPVLRRRWLLCGIAYGVLAYFVMTFVVVPLSNAGGGSISFALPVTPVLINGLLIHALGVGVPAAYFASRTS